MTDRTGIHTDGTFNDQTGTGAGAAVITRSTSGRQEGTSCYVMELRALVEAVKMADGPCTIVSDHEDIVRIARKGRVPEQHKELWEELYVACEGKEIQFEWCTRGKTLGSRLAHQLARDAAKGR